AITLDASMTALLNGRYAGKAFDNRAGLVVILELLRRLQGVQHAWDVYAVADVNEEHSNLYVGALTSTFRIRPQLALCLDVTHAQQPGASQDDEPQLGRGPCIAGGANAHPLVYDKLRQVAVRAAIPHQLTVYGGNTETNSWMMQVAAGGVPTCLIEIPLRYMHTPVEVLQLDDVMNAAALLSGAIASLTLEDAEALEGEHFVRAPAPAAPRPAAAPRRAARRAPRRSSAHRAARAKPRRAARVPARRPHPARRPRAARRRR